MKVFIRISVAALAIAAGTIALWFLLFALFSLGLYYFGPIQGVAAVIFTTSFAIMALIHWSEQGNSPFR